MIRTLGTVFEALHLVIALITSIAGLLLLRRNVDPGVKVLLAWGGWMFVTGVWNIFTDVAYYAQPVPLPPPWVNTVSTVFKLGGPLVLYVIAVYAVWRFWKAGGRSSKV